MKITDFKVDIEFRIVKIVWDKFPLRRKEVRYVPQSIVLQSPVPLSCIAKLYCQIQIGHIQIIHSIHIFIVEFSKRVEEKLRAHL